MSLRRDSNPNLGLKKVYLSGSTGKSVVFQTAAQIFLSERDLQHPNIDAFYYAQENYNYQIYLRDLFDFDGPSADNLTTPYREADCIILVYDPTDQTSLDRICRHYNRFIHGETDATVLLLRNLYNPNNDPILITIKDEADTLSTVEHGNLLGRELHSVNTGRRFVYSVFGSENNIDDIETFFRVDLMEFLSQMDLRRYQADTGGIQNQDRDCCYYLCQCLCCCCSDSEEDDEQILVQR